MNQDICKICADSLGWTEEKGFYLTNPDLGIFGRVVDISTYRPDMNPTQALELARRHELVVDFGKSIDSCGVILEALMEKLDKS